MVLCGLGMQQYAMHNATTQETIFFELGVYVLGILIKLLLLLIPIESVYPLPSSSESESIKLIQNSFSRFF